MTEPRSSGGPPSGFSVTRTAWEVAAAVEACSEDELYQDGVAARAGMKEVRVGEQLRHFAAAGMLTRLPKNGNIQPYRKKPSAYWRMCRELVEEIAGASHEAPGSRRSAE